MIMGHRTNHSLTQCNLMQGFGFGPLQKNRTCRKSLSCSPPYHMLQLKQFCFFWEGVHTFKRAFLKMKQLFHYLQTRIWDEKWSNLMKMNRKFIWDWKQAFRLAFEAIEGNSRKCPARWDELVRLLLVWTWLRSVGEHVIHWVVTGLRLCITGQKLQGMKSKQ